MHWNLFSQAKVCPPRMPAKLVAREHLDDPLRRIVGRAKLVMLCAPAGYGKTAALVRLLAELPSDHALAWVNASDDDDMPRLLACLVSALGPLLLPWRIPPEDLPAMALEVGALQRVAEEIRIALQGLRAPVGLIVIDDLHRVVDPRVFRFLDLLLGRLPPRWTLVITSRTQLPLPCAAMVREGTAVEFREPELRFRRDEALALGREAPMRCPVPVLDEWLQRTGGWPVALVAGLMSARGSIVSASSRLQLQRHMFDYLAEEVMAQLPSAMQAFLMRCSVLSELTAHRCEHITGDHQAARWLWELERRSLFVTASDAEGGSLCLHELFREFLQNRLSRELPGELGPLLRRAADQEADVIARVSYLVRSGDAQAAIAELNRTALLLIQTRSTDQVLRLVERFPESLRKDSPDLAFLAGLAAWHGWFCVSASRSLLQACEGFERAGRTTEAAKARALAAVALVHSGRVAEARVAVADLPDASMLESGARLLIHIAAFVLSCQDGPDTAPETQLRAINDLLHASPEARPWLDAVHTLHLYAGRRGLALQMQRLVRCVAERAHLAPAYTRGWACVLEAWLSLWRANVTQAREAAARAKAQVHAQEPLAPIRIPLQLLEVFDLYLAGQAGDAIAMLDGMREAAAESPEQKWELLFEYLAGAMSCARGDLQRAQQAVQWIQERSHISDWPFVGVAVRALRAELLLQSGQVSGAVAEYRSIAQRSAEVDWGGLHARVHVGWACAELSAGDRAAAWRALGPALDWAARSQETLGLLLCGPAALARLAHVAWPADACVEEVDLLKQCARIARRLTGRTRSSAGDDEPIVSYGLSERELEVLQLVAKGHNNKQIAAALALSPHTVKRHVANILERIECSSRHAAAAWYLRHMQ